MISRKTFFTLLSAAKAAGMNDYARMLATDWLEYWPGDLKAQSELAQIEMSQKRYGSAIDRLTRLVETDPENIGAYQLLTHCLARSGDPVRSATYKACAAALKGDGLALEDAPGWYQPLVSAVRSLAQSKIEAACDHSRQAVLADIHLPLPNLIAMKAHTQADKLKDALNFAKSGVDRWPKTIAFRLVLAEHLLLHGNPEQGLEELHRCVASDPGGGIAARYLGSNHSYIDLWPEELVASLSRPVPAAVNAVLGENRLAGATAQDPEENQSTAEKPSNPPAHGLEKHDAQVVPKSQGEFPQQEPWEAFDGPDPGNDPGPARPSLSEALAQVKSEFNRLAQRVNASQSNPDQIERNPVYLTVSSRTRLLQEMGKDGFSRVDEALQLLTRTIQRRPGWSAHKLYLDDPKSLRAFDLKPVDPSNAWQIKLRLSYIDAVLAERGQMIGAILIVGDHSIVPFHMLPNPTEDEDEDVPSDNPYSNTDENYFVPEWMVGRLPTTDSDLLTRLLRQAVRQHQIAAQPDESSSGFRDWLATHFGRFFGIGPQSVGYTASIWRKASMAVFRSIGEPGNLLASPPVQAKSLPSAAMKPSTLSYYNLHGLEDAAEWYGQRDPFRDHVSDEEFPIALRIEDVVNSGRAPKIVFTEACYGANVMGKTPDTALSLRFLDRGSHAVIGSTKISYGSVTPPLIAADFLGLKFWENLNKRLPVGEALRRAKLDLASEMHKRQGYIDGEDQKALISFVLFGDPLYSPRNLVPRNSRKSIARRTDRPASMKTTCALGGPKKSPEELDEQAQERLKSIVSQYLPGMQGATCTIHNQHNGCDADDHLCPSHQVGIKGLPQKSTKPMVVTLAKTIQAGDRRHPHYARLTLDDEGKVLKLAVSR